LGFPEDRIRQHQDSRSHRFVLDRAQYPDSPAFFEESDQIGIADLGLSEVEKAILVSNVKAQHQSLFSTVFPGTTGGKLVRLVEELSSVTGTDRYISGFSRMSCCT